MEIIKEAIVEFGKYKKLGDGTIAQLSEADLNAEPAEGVNSIATIVRHMQGNMISRWTNFLTEDGEKPYRERDAEFSDAPLTRDELIERWELGWTTLFNALEELEEDDLQKTIYIRAQPQSVSSAILRQLAHYSSHVGQMMTLGKWRKGEAWQSLSIPPGGSAQFNEKLMKKS